MTSTQPVRSRAVLTGISSRAWEHPADRGALVALRKLKGFDTVLKAISGLVNERTVRLVYLGSTVRVDERQFAGLHRLLGEVGRTLDVAELPELFVTTNPTTGAMTIGMDKPFIVLNSGTVDLLDEDELRFVLGHELGHALSGHAVYRTLLERMLHLAGVLAAVPGGTLGSAPSWPRCFEWQRKSELSADRAGLLATQDPATAFRVHMKFASGRATSSELDQTSFFAQGQEYLEAGDLRDSVLKLLLVEDQLAPLRRRPRGRAAPMGRLGRLHPRPVRRLPAPRGRRPGQGHRCGAEARRQLHRDLQAEPGHAVGSSSTTWPGFFGSAKLWLDEQLRRSEELTWPRAPSSSTRLNARSGCPVSAWRRRAAAAASAPASDDVRCRRGRSAPCGICFDAPGGRPGRRAGGDRVLPDRRGSAPDCQPWRYAEVASCDPGQRLDVLPTPTTRS